MARGEGGLRTLRILRIGVRRKCEFAKGLRTQKAPRKTPLSVSCSHIYISIDTHGTDYAKAAFNGFTASVAARYPRGVRIANRAGVRP